jgi:hypothetical protein
MVTLGDDGTLAQLYGTLTSDDPRNAWTRFRNAIDGLPKGVTGDDPFAAMADAGQKAELASVRATLAPLATPTVARACRPRSRRLLPPGVAKQRAA